MSRKSRRIRLSVFEEGLSDKTSAPMIHHACKTLDRAEKLFAGYAAKRPKCRVVMHEGNLRKFSYRIIRDTHPEPFRMDVWTAQYTAFSSMEEMLSAPGGYFPSLNVSRLETLVLANTYDLVQAQRGDCRRVNRWGIPFGSVPFGKIS